MRIIDAALIAATRARESLVQQRIQSQLLGEYNTKVMTCPAVAKTCVVSLVDVSGIRHALEVEAESLYEAAVLDARRFAKIRGLRASVTRSSLTSSPRAISEAFDLASTRRRLAGRRDDESERGEQEGEAEADASERVSTRREEVTRTTDGSRSPPVDRYGIVDES
jgi:hypothetical protein